MNYEEEITRALNGQPSAAQEQRDQDIVDLLNGRPTKAQQPNDDDTSAAFSGQALSALESQSRTILRDCYEEAQQKPFLTTEAERLNYAADKAKFIAEEMNAKP